MLREEVADHYRRKGYSIRENVKVRGKSGAIHACDMVATSPLGNLVIAFEDEGGFEGPEMNAVRRTARDVGATPVVAAMRIPAGVRRHASEAGVVLLDPEALQAPEPELPEPTGAVAYPPWPGQEKETATQPQEPRAWPGGGGRATLLEPVEVDDLVEDVARRNARRPIKVEAPAPRTVKVPRADEKEPDFAWLPKEPKQEPVKAVKRPKPEPATGMRFWHWAVLAAIFGATTAGVFFALLRLVG